MKCGSNWFADLSAVCDCRVREEERRIDMNDVRPITCLPDDGFVGVTVEKVMLFAKRLEDGKMEYSCTEIPVGNMLFGFIFRFVTA